MPRARRSEFRGAIQLVTLTGFPEGNVFYNVEVFKEFPDNPRGHSPDAELFESLLWDVCEQYNASVHAYVVEPNTALMVIQTLGAPLAWILHDLLARFSMHLIEHHRVPKGKRPFPRRYAAQVVQPSKLPYAVRYVQRRQIPADRRRLMANHPFSSNLIYCGRRPRPKCFVVHAMREALQPLGYLGSSAYFEFMASSDSPSIVHMLSRPIIGERWFAELVREGCRKMPRGPSPDDILREVTASLLHTEPRVACTSTHLGALARALVAWYAMRTGTAQIGAVARWFGVTRSDLRYLIRRHRSTNPEYFSQSLFELFPALSVQADVQPRAQARTLPSPEVVRGRPTNGDAHRIL